ncbi:MAG: inositol monophosphatase family protein, partial [Planctomycetota bacterium]|nr:inositol monophosphatase family protein [Planctomycetota bacterium]
MPDPDLQLAMETARRAAEAGAAASMPYFRTGVARQEKADGSFVTEADLAAEKAILEVITGAFPKHSVFTEESGSHPGDPDHRWIVDPLDGTHRFARGLSFWGPLIALESRGEIIAGSLAMPVVGDVYWAARGLGCFRNGERCRVSQSTDWKRANLSMGALSRILALPCREGALSLMETCEYTVAGGDLNGCALVISGRAEAWIEAGVQTWDIAPMKILIEEAGGKFT